ncbi:SNF2 family N-terminal domain-containing protein [Annulohypoxylon nitens]|nr:SNF2 family N-terminal domain-containing protein [Annulohypoxylon nitens]
MEPEPVHAKRQVIKNDYPDKKRIKLVTNILEEHQESTSATSSSQDLSLPPPILRRKCAITDECHNMDICPPQEEEICFGMIPEVVTQLRWRPKNPEQNLSPLALPDGQSFIRMALDIQEDIGFIQITNGEPIAVLSNHTFRAISSLNELESVAYQPWVASTEWDEKLSKFINNGTKSKKIQLRVDILICGARRHAESVAQSLHASELYLQSPHTGMAQCYYDNLYHQRTGVDFFAWRENQESCPNYNLWQKNISEQGEVYYQHVITGAKNQSAVDCAGGILADDMGLGKTLTTLSSIVNSMDIASRFVQENGEGIVNDMGTGDIQASKPSDFTHTRTNRLFDRPTYPDAIRFIAYHGVERKKYDATLSNYDIVLTTYSTAMVEFRRRPNPLYGVEWYRLVLDEAHTIRNSSSKLFECVNCISSKIRWCITGTPIQNSLDDLGSLVRFLRVPIMENSAMFRKHISRTGLHKGSASEEFDNLRLLLGSICLRRNKSVLASPGVTNEHCQVEFTPHEREQYELLELTFKRAINFAANGPVNGPRHHRVMEALLRLRIFCNNGPEVSGTMSGFGSDSQSDEILSILQQGDAAICSYCSCDILSASRQEDSQEGYLTRCLRLVCCECTTQYRIEHQGSGSGICPLCKSQHAFEELGNDHAAFSGSEKRQYPSKIKTLVQRIEMHYLQDKCVIFSFWKKTLDIVSSALEEKGIKHQRIDGSIASSKRHAVLNEFQSRSASRVLLLTFSTGATGLNGLTVANRIHILEPQWNPAVENQAVGRLLRIDQTSKVTVIRYVMHRSIEEIVQSRQHRKIQLAKGGFMNAGDECQQKFEQLGEMIGQQVPSLK